jgi:hypothetical protein
MEGEVAMWEKIENQSAYIGDIQDLNGRRHVIIITSGVAVFAKCKIEDYYLMKNDFETFFTETEFIQAAILQSGYPVFSSELENNFDEWVHEDVNKYLNKTLV